MQQSPIAWLFPGQGCQSKGMGEVLFEEFPELVSVANSILNYSVTELCLNNPDNKLVQTEFSQPAIYVVNALYFHRATKNLSKAQFYAGHSLGEYNALYAAGCFSFEEGLRLVIKRGQLMGKTVGGRMAAVLGVNIDVVRDDLLKAIGPNELNIANINSPTQIVVSGSIEDIEKLSSHTRQLKTIRVVPLSVSAAFHSHYMNNAAIEFSKILKIVQIQEPNIPVIANVTGDFYAKGEIRKVLSKQINSSVKWWDSLVVLRNHGVNEIQEIGPGSVLTDLWNNALKIPISSTQKTVVRNDQSTIEKHTLVAQSPYQTTSRLGAEFCKRHSVRLPYIAGSMFRGIASTSMVIRMGRSGLLGFFGSGGLSIAKVKEAIVSIITELGADTPFGVNLLSTPDQPELEQSIVDLCLQQGVRFVEASAFTQLSSPIVEFRFRGACVSNGHAYAPNQIFAKVSRSEVAERFLLPPSEELLKQLYEQGKLTSEEIAAARRLPVSADVCVEADSGGHTDGGISLTLLPSIVRLRNDIAKQTNLDEPVRIGAAGGLGSPEAIAAVFVLGAEFVLAGSINQCTPEANTSTTVKDLLSNLGLHDTAYAPAGDLFELGAKVQVVKKGTLFSARANQLYQIYRIHDGFSSLSKKSIGIIERILGRSVDEVWTLSRERLAMSRPKELERILRSEKARMARVFKWYFSRSIEFAQTGNLSEKVNYQIHCSPAMGAFNYFSRNKTLEDWRNRYVDIIADELMERAEYNLRSQKWNKRGA